MVGLVVPELTFNSINVKVFGATGDGVTDDRSAIQRGIDYCNSNNIGELYFPSGTYLVGLIAWPGPTAGAYALELKSNVVLRGQSRSTAIIKLKNNAFGSGAFWRIVTSSSASTIVNSGIKDITFNGNKDNQIASTNGGNILLEICENLNINNVASINARGQGIQVRNSTSTYGTNINIENCYVSDVDYIGIQVSQFDGIKVNSNYIKNTVDNAIDFYGNDGSVIPHAKNFIVSNNIIDNAPFGIFLETVKDGIASDNIIKNCTTSGIAVNRINGAPGGILIDANNIVNCPIGVRFSGDCNEKGVVITNNYFKDFNTSGLSFGLAGNASYVEFANNTFCPSETTTVIISIQGNQIAYVKGRNNTVFKDNFDSTKLVSNTATISVSIIIEQWYGLSTDLGPSFYSLNGFTETLIATTGTVNLSPPTNYGGVYYVTAKVTGWGTATAVIPFRNENGSTIVGAVVYSDPSTTFVSIAQNPSQTSKILITLHGGGAGKVNVFNGIFVPLPS